MFIKRVLAVIPGLMVAVLVTLSACSSGISQEDYNRLKDELSDLQARLELAQSQNASGQVSFQQYQDLSSRYTTLESDFRSVQASLTVLQAQLATLRQQYDAREIDYETLRAQYETLKKDYARLTADNISTDDIEQAIFDLINRERSLNGLAELAWGKNLYLIADTNNQVMTESKSRTPSSYASWQDVHWATGYRTVGDIALATLTIWQNGLQYQQNFLNAVAAYGAVAVYQSGDIYYITYIASQFP
jgi:hypothetical protein